MASYTTKPCCLSQSCRPTDRANALSWQRFSCRPKARRVATLLMHDERRIMCSEIEQRDRRSDRNSWPEKNSVIGERRRRRRNAKSHVCSVHQNNTPSCRRDIARWRSLRRSRSFKVTDFGTNRKLIYDFLLVNNTLVLTSTSSPHNCTVYWHHEATSLYRAVPKVFRYLEPFRRGSEVWQTDGQTDRIAFRNSTVEHR